MLHSAINLLLRAPSGLRSRITVLRLRAMGAHIGRACRLGRIDVGKNPWDLHLEEGVALDRDVTLLAIGPRGAAPRIRIGARTYINRSTMIDASLSIQIGADTMIGPFCYITDHDHGTLPGRIVAEQDMVEAAVEIGRNVWLGAGVIVLKGVTVGDDAVIGAGAVVTRSVEAGARVAGVPARAVPARAAPLTGAVEQ